MGRWVIGWVMVRGGGKRREVGMGRGLLGEVVRGLLDIVIKGLLDRIGKSSFRVRDG